MRLRHALRGARSLRFRLTLTSCVLVGLAAGIGAVAMLTVQRQRLISGIDSGARTQATNVAALAEQEPSRKAWSCSPAIWT